MNVNEKIIDQIINYDYTEIEKIPDQISSINENTKAILDELQKNNESSQEFQTFMMSEEPSFVEEPSGDETEEVPVEEAVIQEITDEDSTEVTEELPAEVTEETLVEEEIIVDYDPLILEQLETLNSHMEVTQELQNKGNQIGAETAFLLAITIVFAAALKVFVDQVTKW